MPIRLVLLAFAVALLASTAYAAPASPFSGSVGPDVKPGRAAVTWRVDAKRVGSWWLWHCPATDGACDLVTDWRSGADHGAIEVFTPTAGEAWLFTGYAGGTTYTRVDVGTVPAQGWTWVMLVRVGNE